jgi:hypothetical protein
LAQAGHGQSAAQAKLAAENSIIGLYNLLPDTTGSEASRRLSGTISQARPEVESSVFSYHFTLSSQPKMQHLAGAGECWKPTSINWLQSSAGFSSGRGSAVAAASGLAKR